MTPFDVAEVRNEIVAYLASHQYTPRDADGADFQFHDDSSLRFKVGTVYGEVTITVWDANRQIEKPIRILSRRQAVEAKHAIDALIARRADNQRTDDWLDSQVEPYEDLNPLQPGGM